MKKIVLISALLLCLNSCSWFNREEVQPDVVLMYIACHNNGLSYYSEEQIEEFSKSILPSTTDKKRIFLVYAHLAGSAPELFRYSSDKNGCSVKELIKTYPEETLSANAQNISSVVAEVLEKYPSEHISLILSSHATGYLPAGYSPESSGDDFSWGYAGSFGPDDKREVDLVDLRKSLSRYHFDCLLFDCCYMGCVEVAYELKDLADYIVSSATEIMGNGLTRGSMIPMMFNEDKQQAAVSICKEYMQYVREESGYQQSGTISAVKTAGLQKLASTTGEIFRNNSGRIAALDTRTVQQYRGFADFGCFYDFEDFIRQIASESELASFNQALAETVVFKDATPTFVGYRITRHSGLSSFIPTERTPKLNEYYKSLSWNKDTGLVR